MDRPPTCKFYQQGCCINEQACPFSHPTRRCRTFTTEGWCPYGLSCHYWHDSSRKTVVSTSAPAVCRFFLLGQCVYGDRCNYSHDLDSCYDDDQLTLQEYRQIQAEQKRRAALRRASCSRASDVRPLSPNYRPQTPSAKPNRPAVSRPSARLEQAYLETVQPADLLQMRDLEVDRLFKRFPHDQIKELGGSGDDDCSGRSVRNFALLFTPSDPDWSHTVKRIVLNLTLPADYPRSPPTIIMPRTSDLPNVLTDHVNEAITAWIAERAQSYQDSNKVALFLRPFFFWIDKKLLELFNEGFQKFSQALTEDVNSDSDAEEEEEEETGAEPIPERFSASSSASTSSEDSADSAVDDDLMFASRIHPESRTNAPLLPPQSSSNTKWENDDEEEEDWTPAAATLDTQTAKSADTERGTLNLSAQQQRITFDDLEFRGQAGTCLLTRVSTTAFCTRCKYVFSWVFRLPPQPKQQPVGVSSSQPSQYQSIPPITSACMRCRQVLGLIFEAQLAHSFSSVVGNFCVANCTIMDVQAESAEVTVHCTKCSSNLKMVGLKPDQLNAKRCLNCHSPCGLTFSSIALSQPTNSFTELTKRFAALSTKPSGQSSKPHKNKNRMDAHAGAASSLAQAHLIQKGTPLPDNGTCQHYRKSYRWFRTIQWTFSLAVKPRPW